MWHKKEDIPNPDPLFYRVHQGFIIEGELIPGVFKERGGGMSTDWSKYSTAQESRNRAKAPERNGIISFITGTLRALQFFVNHAPSRRNRAHTNVNGVNTETRLKLIDAYDWEIRL